MFRYLLKRKLQLTRYIPVFLSFIGISACSDPSSIVLESVTYQEVKMETCRANAENRYHILVPGNLDPSQELPLVIVLDSHGDGKMAVEKFKPAVNYFTCLVAGSDLIKNNFPGFENALMQLLDDIIKKYPVDKQQIIISGFSGGARMAYYFALHQPVQGVLMCGAGPGAQRPSCPVYTISGMGDFNFSEQYIHPDIGSFDNDQFTSDYFHGIHEWPRPEQLSDALVFLLRDHREMEKVRHKRVNQLMQVADSLEREGDEIMAWKALEKAAKVSVNNSEKKEASERGSSLLMKKEFRDAIQTLEHYLNEEKNLQQTYSNRLLTGDTEWWKQELTTLNDNLSASGNGLEQDHYLRIKGFVGILLYSAINTVIHKDPHNPQLEVMLDTYAFAEPENPDVYFFRALYAYNSGDRESCVENLDRSLKLGFSDLTKLDNEFPGDIISSIRPDR